MQLYFNIEGAICAPGYRQSDWTKYLSQWDVNCCKGNTKANRDLCWKKAQKNVLGAVGIWWQYVYGHCRAITNLASLGTLQSTYPNDQSSTKLCVFKPGIQNHDLQRGYSRP